MAYPPNFKISLGIPSGPTDFSRLIADNRFLIMLIPMLKGLPDSVYRICGLLRPKLNIDA
jgi:hypothetical protein